MRMGANGRMEVALHPGQALAMDSLATETYISAGLQSGKTSLLAHWLIEEMIRCGPGNPEICYLAIGPELTILRNKLVPGFRRIFEGLSGWAKFTSQPKMSLTFTPLGEQALWGHEQKEKTSINFCFASDSDSFAGYTALAAVGDETGQDAFRRSSLLEMRGRLSIARGQVAPYNNKVGRPNHLKMGRLCFGSIVYGLGWMYDFYKQWRAAAEDVKKRDYRNFATRMHLGTVHPQMHFVRFDSTRNPAFPPEEFEIARRSLPKWLFDQRYRGIFTRPAGLIFDQWDPQFEVEGIATPPYYPRAAAFDPGDVNFYGLSGAMDPVTQIWTITDLYCDREHSMEWRGEDIVRRWPNLIWCAVGQISEERWRMELLRGGLRSTPPAIKDFWGQVNAVNSAMMRGLLRVDRAACAEVIDDFGTFSRPTDKNTGEVMQGEKPVDEKKRHYMAALRYFGTEAFLARDASEAGTAPPRQHDAPAIGAPMGVLAAGMGLGQMRDGGFRLDQVNRGDRFLR